MVILFVIFNPLITLEFAQYRKESVGAIDKNGNTISWFVQTRVKAETRGYSVANQRSYQDSFRPLSLLLS